MTDKQQIEEILRKLEQGEFCPNNCWGCCADSSLDFTCSTLIDNFAEALYKANYRQVSPNAVVLTAEKLAEFETACRKAWCEAWDKSRAKTAKEILQKLMAMLNAGYYYEEILERLCEQYGVEVQDNV